jgi:hypothetical protein
MKVEYTPRAAAAPAVVVMAGDTVDVKDCGPVPSTGLLTVAFTTATAPSLVETLRTPLNAPLLFVTPLMEAALFEKSPLYFAEEQPIDVQI